jgi:hypothetical protein
MRQPDAGQRHERQQVEIQSMITLASGTVKPKQQRRRRYVHLLGNKVSLLGNATIDVGRQQRWHRAGRQRFPGQKRGCTNASAALSAQMQHQGRCDYAG